MNAPDHTRTPVKATAPTSAPAPEPLPLSGPQFRRFMLVFHIVFLAALALTLLNRWRQPEFAWKGQDWALTGIVVAQIVSYLRFFALTRHQPRRWSAWIAYFVAGYALWFAAWRIEPHFEWVVLAYLGQMFGALPPRLSLPGAACVFALYFPTKLGWEQLTHMRVQDVVSYLALIVGWSALGLFIHKLAVTSAERARLIEQLETAKKELERARQKDAELAVLSERERLAREMHDSLGHGLVTLTVQLEAVQRLYPVDPTKAHALVEDMKRLTRGSTEQLRRALAGLRAPGLGDQKLSQALASLVNTHPSPARDVGARPEDLRPPTPDSALPPKVLSSGDVKLEVNSKLNLDDLPPALAETVWRLAQEGLANMERHAKAASGCIEIFQQAEALVVRVTDDGIGLPEGADNRPGHYGLRGLKERIEGLGGTFRAARQQPVGTLLEARIPLVK